jgi:SAM-dependent methyltransferase
VRSADAADALSCFHTYKRHTFELLQLRPGDRVLDVACGTGDDTRSLAGFVGWSGRVTGVDSRPAMIEEARRRVGDRHHSLEFRVGDAHSLEFTDGVFDGVRADRALQHVSRPDTALAEMVRVSRSGARLVVAEPDWDTLVIDAPDRRLTRAILHFRCDTWREGWAGRRLRSLLADAGLSDVSVIGVSLVTTDYGLADRAFELSRAAEAAVNAGAVHHDAAREWVGALEAAGQTGRFFCAATAFIASGRKK